MLGGLNRFLILCGGLFIIFHEVFLTSYIPSRSTSLYSAKLLSLREDMLFSFFIFSITGAVYNFFSSSKNPFHNSIRGILHSFLSTYGISYVVSQAFVCIDIMNTNSSNLLMAEAVLVIFGVYLSLLFIDIHHALYLKRSFDQTETDSIKINV